MTTPTWIVDTTIPIDRVHVIESISGGWASQTGTRLFEELESICAGTLTAPHLHRLRNARDLWSLLADLTVEARHGHYPLLHFETHGAERAPGETTTSAGLVLASNELVSWSSLAPYLTAINEATRLNLAVFVAACHGLDAAVLMQPLDRAPVRIIVGPVGAPSARAVEKGTRAFYRALFKDWSWTKAGDAMNSALRSEDAAFWMLSAERHFLKILQGYYNEYTTEEQIAARVERYIAPLCLRGVPPAELARLRSEWRAKLRDRQSAFDQAYRRFFFLDKYPELAERFVLSFERCFQEAS